MKQAIKAMQRCDSCRQWSLEMAGALRVAEANGKCDIQRQSGAGVASGAATRSNRRVSGIPRLHMPKLADFGSDSEGGDGDGDDDVGRCGAVGGVNGRGIGKFFFFFFFFTGVVYPNAMDTFFLLYAFE
jgi:hypothetical protein